MMYVIDLYGNVEIVLYLLYFFGASLILALSVLNDVLESVSTHMGYTLRYRGHCVLIL